MRAFFLEGFFCRNQLVNLHFVNAGNPGVTIPLIAAALSPSGHPLLPDIALLMGAAVFGFAMAARLVTFIECSFINIAFLSSHKVMPRQMYGTYIRCFI